MVSVKTEGDVSFLIYGTASEIALQDLLYVFSRKKLVLFKMDREQFAAPRPPKHQLVNSTQTIVVTVVDIQHHVWVPYLQ